MSKVIEATDQNFEDEVLNSESNPIYNSALQAAQEMEKAKERLAQALAELQYGGNRAR